MFPLNKSKVQFSKTSSDLNKLLQCDRWCGQRRKPRVCADRTVCLVVSPLLHWAFLQTSVNNIIWSVIRNIIQQKRFWTEACCRTCRFCWVRLWNAARQTSFGPLCLHLCLHTEAASRLQPRLYLFTHSDCRYFWTSGAFQQYLCL